MRDSVIHMRIAALALLALIGCFTGCRVLRPKFKGPEYVRVESVDGRYWFVRGNDRFLSLGVNVVQPEDGTKPKDGRKYNVLLSKYDHNMARWANDAVARLHAWGFNTVGAWAAEYLYNRVPMYHTRQLWLGHWGPNDPRLVDVFSQSYAAEMDKVCREQVAPYATNEYLIGWFANNELPWYGERGWPSSPLISVLSRYMELNAGASGKAKAVEFLKAQYTNNFQALAENWDVRGATSFDDLAKATGFAPRKRMAKKDVIAWVGIVADEYFKLCADAIRKYDSNHLVLGARFSERAQEPVMAACGKYCDVVSINRYRRTGDFDAKQMGQIADVVKKPILITEFSWRAMENSSGCPNTCGADVTVQTQQDRADGFRRYATNLLAQPYMLGYHWFMYHDQPPSGRFDGENSNYGLVDTSDNIYTTLVSVITEVNQQAATIHATSREQTPVYDPSVLADYRDVTVPGLGHPLTNATTVVDAACGYEVWGDSVGGASLNAEFTTNNTLLLQCTSGRGWGSGITFKFLHSVPTNADGSISVLGASKMIVRIKGDRPFRFSIGINESGCGPTDKQTFDGFGGADGESYGHAEITTSPEKDEYIFWLRETEPSSSYGNQRGNYVLDTQALRQVHLYFPGGQGNITAEFESIRFE